MSWSVRAGRRVPSRQLLLVAVLVAAVIASGCGRSDDAVGAVGAVIAPIEQTDDVPLPPPVEPTPPADIAPALAVDAPSELESEPAQPVGPATVPASAPVRLQVPSIGVDSDLIDLGLEADGTLEVPPGGFPAGWYTGAPTPGELGPAIIAGHVDWGGQPGVFFDLRDLVSGEEIVVTRQDGSTATFRVTRVERFNKDQFPTQAVYGDLDHAGLRLITCGGAFDRQARSYVDNLVVFAELTSSQAR